MCIIYKPGPDLNIVDWLSCNNHKENNNQEIVGMRVNVNNTGLAIEERCSS